MTLIKKKGKDIESNSFYVFEKRHKYKALKSRNVEMK